MSGDPFFTWSNDRKYAGGGEKLARPVHKGEIVVRVDGSLYVSPDDDFYSGEVAPDKALELAKSILAAHEAKR